MRATNDFTVPDNLLGLAGADERSRLDASASLPGSAVTYTLRFYTGDKMGSGLTTPDAGVQVMLISADGRAFMQRVDRYPDVGEADANLALYSSPRFNRGDVDEVSFASPDLGCPAAIWIAPEAGGEWFLEEVELSCSEGSSMALAAAADADHARFAAPDSETGDRRHWVSFPCRERLGDVGSEALELRPSAFIKMTAEQRAAMRAEGLREYGELKLKMLAATGAAVVLGCAVTAASSRNSGDFEALRAFAAGGGVGMTYLWMLTLSIDTLGGGSAPPPGPGDADRESPAPSLGRLFLNAVLGAASSGPVRLLLLGAAGAFGSDHIAKDAIDAHVHYGDALAAVLGFFTYKAGVLVAGFSGADWGNGPPEPALAPIPVDPSGPDKYPTKRRSR